MGTTKVKPYSYGIVLLIMLSAVSPAFAEVATLQTNSDSFFKGGQIIFSGTVEKNSNGLVTIVIRDVENDFVMLTQALIGHDDSFEKTVNINDKFSKHGIYTATGFILNMTEGDTAKFGISLNGVPVMISKENNKADDANNLGKNEIMIDEVRVTSASPDPAITTTTTGLADFVDANKDPRHYVDRYYDESAYKEWFDRNYPELTIEEAVGYADSIEEIQSTVKEIIDSEIVPQADASLSSSITEQANLTNDNSEVAEVSLAVAGLGFLFGAVYGIKRKVDDNSRQISINRETLRKKIIQPIVGSNPQAILRTRLAKGEITLDEYEKLKNNLK